MSTCGIYRIQNKQNGKFYLGSSCDIQRRWRDGHVNKLRKNQHETIKQLYLTGEYTQRKISQMYNVQPPRICKILKKLGVK